MPSLNNLGVVLPKCVCGSGCWDTGGVCKRHPGFEIRDGGAGGKLTGVRCAGG